MIKIAENEDIKGFENYPTFQKKIQHQTSPNVTCRPINESSSISSKSLKDEIDIMLKEEPEERKEVIPALTPHSEAYAMEDQAKSECEGFKTLHNDFEIPAGYIIIDEVGSEHSTNMTANQPFDGDNILLDNERVMEEEVRSRRLYNHHKLVMAMHFNHLRDLKPTLYEPKGIVNIGCLLKHPNIELSSLVRDISYMRELITPFACIINAKKWFLNIDIKNAVLFDLDCTPVCNGKLYLPPLSYIFGEAEVITTTLYLKDQTVFPKYILGVQVYYRLIYYCIASARLNACNDILSSIDCLKISLKNNIKFSEYFILLERIVIKSFYDLISDIEKEKLKKSNNFKMYKQCMKEEFFHHFEKFLLVVKLHNGPILSGLSTGLELLEEDEPPNEELSYLSTEPTHPMDESTIPIALSDEGMSSISSDEEFEGEDYTLLEEMYKI